MSIDYAAAGALTALDGVPAAVLAPVDGAPVEICWPVHSLVIQPTDAGDAPAERLAENQIRPAADLIDRLLRLDAAPLDVARSPQHRVIGTCRHFAVLACALLRHRRVPARVRCGFATYFQPGHALDHWIVEYHEGSDWIRVDAEVLGGDVLARPERLEPGQFLSGGEAWLAYRRGEIDASTFGVFGTENFGPAEIRGNAVKDLAALNKIEMLPWDEWGRMGEAYEHRTGADYDEALDELAIACARDVPDELAALYGRPEFRVPDALLT